MAKKHNVVVIADEVYEWLVYEGGPKMIRFGELYHNSIRLSLNGHFLASLPGMWERTITIGSAGKTFSVTGWKVHPGFLSYGLDKFHFVDWMGDWTVAFAEASAGGASELHLHLFNSFAGMVRKRVFPMSLRVPKRRRVILIREF